MTAPLAGRAPGMPGAVRTLLTALPVARPAGARARDRSTERTPARADVRPGPATGDVAEGSLQLGTRLWASMAALGFGLVAAGIGSGHLEHHLAVGIAVAALGLVAIGWSLAALRGPAPAPRAAVGVLLVAGPAVLLTSPLTGTATTAAEGAALVLALGAAIALALGARAATAPGTRRRAGAGGQVALLASGALLVAMVTVPGLAATEAGAHAVPHGSHGSPSPGLPAEQSHHGGH